MLKARIESTRVFFDEVVAEMKKTTWPTRQELISSTMVVIYSLVLLSAYILVCDDILRRILNLLT